MQTWATRGLRAVLVTGGLLMLGTGIASASENVNPDRPATPIDGGVPIPVHITATPTHAFGVTTESPGNEEADSLNNSYPMAGGGNTFANGDHGAFPGDVVTAQFARVEPMLGRGLTGAGNATAGGSDNASGGDVRSRGEWGALSGDLLSEPATDVTRAGGNPTAVPAGAHTTVFRVPVDVLGDAIDSGHTGPPISDGDTAPRLDFPADAFGFGPADQVDRLLGANQVPGLLPVTGDPVGLRDMQHTQVLPAIQDRSPETQVFSAITDDQAPPPVPAVRPSARIQATPPLPTTPPRPITPARRTTPARPAAPAWPVARDVPISGELPVGDFPLGQAPVSANLPRSTSATAPVPNRPTPVQSGQSISPELALPDLPPVPTLPAMPSLPGRPTQQDLPAAPALPSPTLSAPHLTTPSLPNLPTRHVSGPPANNVTGHPATHDMPAGPAQQLMSQLRGLIDDLDNGRHMHPMFDDDLPPTA
jgi:hypothetical protein